MMTTAMQKIEIGSRPAWVAGNAEIISDSRFLAVVGSRNADADRIEIARRVGRAAAGRAVTIVSGGALGIDRAAMFGTLDAGGAAVGILCCDLKGQRNNRIWKDYVATGRLALILFNENPAVPFSVRAAHARNADIYKMGGAALVVASVLGSGGTWTGALECLQKSLCTNLWAVPGTPGCDVLLKNESVNEFSGDFDAFGL